MRSSPSDADHGWAFVVLFLVCVSRFLSFGMLLSTPLLYIIFLNDLQESPVLTSWVVNMNFVILNVCSLIGNMIIKVAGVRATAVLGCLISSAGLLATAFAPSLEWMLLTFGIFTGFGYAFSYISHLEMLSLYLVKYRKIAFAAVGTAASLGQFAYTPVLYALCERFHWRGAFMILSAVNLNLLLAAVAAFKSRKTEEVIESGTEGGTLLPSSRSLHDSKKSKPCCRGLFTDFNLFLNVNFILFVISNTALWVGFGVFRTHMGKYSELQGHTDIQVASLITIMSIVMVICRILTGIVLQVSNVNMVLSYAAMNALAGVFIACYGLISNYIALVVMASLIGFSLSAYPQFAEVVIILVGADKLAAGVSLAGIFSAIGIFGGGPLAAFIYQHDPSYISSFLTGGLMHLACGLLLIPTAVKSLKSCKRSSCL